jgi:predicted oxidoreductase
MLEKKMDKVSSLLVFISRKNNSIELNENGVVDPIFFALICNMEKKLVAGTMRWGSWGAKFSTQQYAETISKWIDCGVFEFDLANLYGDYSCEKEFGKALGQLDIPRDSVSLISKMGIENPSSDRNNAVKHYNYSKEHIVRCAEQSLRDLQTDYLDVLLLHRPSPMLDVNEVAEAVADLISSGKIKSFGVSNFLPEQIDWLGKYVQIDHNQISFSLSDYTSMESGHLEAFAKRDLNISAYSPILNLVNASQELNSVLDILAEKYNVTKAALCVIWVLKHPLINSCVIGTSRIERISEVRRALDVDIELQDYFKLWEAARGTRVP